MFHKRRVLLTPLAISDDQGYFVCIAIRDPKTEEIIETAVTSDELASKTDIPLREAQEIFKAAYDAADHRLTG